MSVVCQALVDCAVLSLQDTIVFYPCCKGCFCRIDEDLEDTRRCRCSRCGYSCAREHVDFRYRLSLRVTRDARIFVITVFGTCLNPFFGTPASGLKRLVESLEGPFDPSIRSTVLARAVEDCFIGRHFLFGLKVPSSEPSPWSSCPNTDPLGPFSTSQMVLPAASGLVGCSVVSYYQRLLQEASEPEPSDPQGSFKPGSALLLTPRFSPNNSVTNPTLSVSSLDWSLSRSRHLDISPSRTSPWQQSPGLTVLSSDCSYEDVQRNNTSRTGSESDPSSAEGLSRHSLVQRPSSDSVGRFSSINSSLPDTGSHSPLPSNTSCVDWTLSDSLFAFLCDNQTESRTDLLTSWRTGRKSMDVSRKDDDVYNCSADLFSASSEAPLGSDTSRSRTHEDFDPDAFKLSSHFLPPSQSTPIFKPTPACRSLSADTLVSVPKVRLSYGRRSMGRIRTSCGHRRTSEGLSRKCDEKMRLEPQTSQQTSRSCSDCCSGDDDEACDWSRDLFTDQ